MTTQQPALCKVLMLERWDKFNTHLTMGFRASYGNVGEVFRINNNTDKKAKTIVCFPLLYPKCPIMCDIL